MATDQQIADYKEYVVSFADSQLIAATQRLHGTKRLEQIQMLLADSVDTEGYVIDDELQLVTLQASDHATAGLFDCMVKVNSPSEQFPFAGFAASAFQLDVMKYVVDRLKR